MPGCEFARKLILVILFLANFDKLLASWPVIRRTLRQVTLGVELCSTGHKIRPLLKEFRVSVACLGLAYEPEMGILQ